MRRRLLAPTTLLFLALFLGSIARALPPVEPGSRSGAATKVGSSTAMEAEHAIWLPTVRFSTRQHHPLAQLINPVFTLGYWFEAKTGRATDATYFGIYKIEPAGDTLYLGFGSGRPADKDGALLASTNGESLTAIFAPDEQGFIDMTWTGERLFIPGVDPTDLATPPAHQWDWGNTYVYTPDQPIVKHRNLSDVIHAWGDWYNPDSGVIYLAVSSHQGDYETWTGEIWKSTDAGASWTRLADRDDDVGEHRTYDIIGFDDKLYATWNDVYEEPCGLVYSKDEMNWRRIGTLAGQITCRTRLFVFKDQLLALSADRTALLALSPDHQISTRPFPGFHVQDWAYNYLAADSDGRLYTISHDGLILRTADLTTWEIVANSDRAFITLAFWPEKNWIVVADRGREQARLWKLEP